MVTTKTMMKKCIILLLLSLLAAIAISTTTTATTTTVFVSAFTTTTTTTSPPLRKNNNNNNFVRTNRGTAVFMAVSKTRRKSAQSPLVEEALREYKFTFRPDNELPGTKGRPIFSTSERQAKETFNELARLYGDEEALDMVKIQPMVLCFQSKNFEPCLDAWTEQFGLDAAKAMVNRNPGLLGVSPQLAAQPAEASMGLSYVVALTRPSIPKFVALVTILSFVSSSSTSTVHQ